MKKAKNLIDQWQKLRPLLNNLYSFNENWNEAIGLFEERFLNYYLTPLDSLINKRDYKGEGFAITTIICSYIEALAAFKYGKIYNSGFHPKNSPSFEYRSSSALYIRFLTSEEVFKDNFWQLDSNGKKQSNKPFSAIDFYENVRCALVHEAMTKNGWYINARKSDKMNSPVFIEANKGDKYLMRSILHARMIDYLINYTAELRSNNLAGEVTRRLFARKMDHLCEIVSDDIGYEWWAIGSGD